jgi:hypothetical protein
MTRLVARIGVCCAVVVTTAFAAVYLVKAVSQLGDTATTNSVLSYDDREIAGGNSLIVDQTVAYEARRLIPEDAEYRFIIGSGLHKRTPLTENNAEGWFQYFLMPRHPQPGANWIICYGCERAQIGGSSVVRWHDEDGISIRQRR